ncbi:MAG: T9SS type A sorting domain-containing protein, partial [Ignavibacteriaceae bacterium]|nr:T9SS type A sorting domain-containing protein [Ignavibacteriaceae bacterium]
TNLASQSVTSNAVTLTWTAPADTSYGGVTKYIGKYSTSPITDTNSFNSAANLNITGAPKPAGQTETFTVTGLNFATQYYFAIRSSDRWNNISVMSNVISATTLAAPVVTAAPDSIMRVMQSNQTLVDSVMLSNIALNPSTLDYTVTLENNSFPGNIKVSLVPQQVTSLEVKFPRKDDAEPTGFSIEGQGGPDAGGYKWIDSDEPNGPAFEWNDIATTGTELTNWLPTGTFGAKDEGYAGPVSIPFQFKYYDVQKTQVFVSSNGAVLFAAPTANMFTNAQIPTAAAPNDMLAPFWDDLDGTNGGNVYYKAEGNRLILQYNNWSRYSTSGSSLTFQVVLYSNGRIMFYYKTMTSSTMNSATVGIENGDGSVGLPVAYNAVYVKNNHAVKFSADPEWLSTNSMGGTLSSGTSAAIRLEMRSEDYPPGQYRMEVKIASNDPVKPMITVPVNLLIGDVPVELTSLNAAAEGNSVTLNWSTATETNNKGFRIERSSQNSGWISAGYLAGKGNTAEISAYQFTERNLNAGAYTYRLVQEDYDGTITIYTAPEVTVDRPEVYSLSQNYPNPFNPATSISFTLPEAARVTLTVYSTLGEQVLTLLSSDLEAGYHKAEFDASQLTSGTYIYTLRASAGGKTFTDSKKMILIK